jgi:hypothetical protein
MRKLLAIAGTMAVMGAGFAAPAHAVTAVPPYSFNPPGFYFTEGSTGSIMVIRTANLTTVPKISCVFTQDTGPSPATQGEFADYPRTSSPLVFTRNATSAFCEFPTRDDVIRESAETLSVRLVGPANAALTPAATITILDNDGIFAT